MTMKLSNGHSARQLTTQLQHDSEQKVAERKAALRRDVYLPAAEAIVKLSGRMGALPQLDLANIDAQLEFANFGAAIAKVQLVGEPETAALAGEVLSEYGSAFMRCVSKAGTIQLERAYAAIQDNLYNDAQLQVKRLLAEMTALNESGAPDPAKFQRLNDSFQFFSKQAEDRAGARAGHQETAGALQMQYLQDTVAKMKSLNVKYLPLVVAIRHELGFEGDLMHFQRMLERQTAEIEEAVDGIIRDMKARPSAGSRTG
ncbi:MAG: hypothetical protein JSR49_09215 [Proteobacteria bacterium]|nr:hypothetical protein [Pseudomonadota bacterium]